MIGCDSIMANGFEGRMRIVSWHSLGSIELNDG